jgi:hypothetical protein
MTSLFDSLVLVYLKWMMTKACELINEMGWIYRFDWVSAITLIQAALPIKYHGIALLNQRGTRQCPSKRFVAGTPFAHTHDNRAVC